MQADTQDKRYMQMALKLAARGFGAVEPNPMVGCVIVQSNQIYQIYPDEQIMKYCNLDKYAP